MFAFEQVIPFIDCDADGYLKNHTAIAMMMNSCQFQEFQEQGFKQYLVDNHIAIFLFSMQLDILRRPKFREKVETSVKIYGCKSIYGLRQLAIKDEQGQVCMLANATGAFFDVIAKKAVKLNPEDLKIKFDEALPMECLPRKIAIPTTEPTLAYKHTVVRSDLDMNRHMTSPLYFAHGGNALPPDFQFDRIRAEFKQQAKLHEELSFCVYDTGDGKRVIDIRNGENLSCCTLEYSTRGVHGTVPEARV